MLGKHGPSIILLTLRPICTEDMEERIVRPRSKIVLVVDDDPVMLESVTELMDLSLNAKVISCSDGREAWELCQEIGHIDLIISDIEMPRMNGLELLSLIKIHQPNTSCILVSGDHTYKYMALDMGADAFFPKPFKIGQLIHTARFCLAKFHKNIVSQVYVPAAGKRAFATLSPVA